MSNRNNKSVIKGIRFEHGLIAEINKRSNNFSEYVKTAVREKMQREDNKND